MLDREKIVAVLKKRFPGAPVEQFAAATNAIIGLDDEWEELLAGEPNPCEECCRLAAAGAQGTLFKVLRKRSVE
jgi:hypothetical protein